MPTSFQGYRRENGRVGVRNHVILLPVDDLSNAVCEAVAHNVKGALAIPHPYGRLQFGADLDLHFRTLIGTGANPNVAAVVVIGIEDQWTQKVVEGIATTGKPVQGFGIELHGDHDTIMVGRNYGLRGLPYVGRILIPAAFPSILTGLKIGWAFAWRTLIAAELVFGVSSGSGGLGWFIYENKNQLEIPNVFAGLFTVIVIGLIVENVVFRVVEAKTVRKWGLQS